MAKPDHIELGDGTRIPILYEDRSVLAIDKPADWMLVPYSWQKTNRNLHAALVSSITAGHFWARSRSLKFLCHVHRLDAETTGILLLAKSPGAVETYGRLFESRRMAKTYFAVVHGMPGQTDWTSRFKLAPEPKQIGKMKVDPVVGKEAETRFRLLQTKDSLSLVEARPITGRTHQIRVHLAEAGIPVVGDALYGRAEKSFPRARRCRRELPLGLRAVFLAYLDPFSKRRVEIKAPFEEFLRSFGFDSAAVEVR